jgi:hypothetical protein
MYKRMVVLKSQEKRKMAKDARPLINPTTRKQTGEQKQRQERPTFPKHKEHPKCLPNPKHTQKSLSNYFFGSLVFLIFLIF